MTIGCTCGMVGCSFGCMQRQRDTLRVELAECRASNAKYDAMTRAAIKASSDDAERASFNLRRAEAAEARAERLHNLIDYVLRIHSHRRVSDFMNQFNEWRQFIADCRAALAETEKEKP